MAIQTHIPTISERAELAPPVDEQLLGEIARRLSQALPSCCVVLFGSQAYGAPRGDSDVDLMVIAESDRDPFAMAGQLNGLLSPRRIPIDLIFMTPERFRTRMSRFDPFMHEAIGKGRVLYGHLRRGAGWVCFCHDQNAQRQQARFPAALACASRSDLARCRVRMRSVLRQSVSAAAPKYEV
ncbi:MAG: nucleotidyltransferase domain-containing protein [Phycisphaerae bacterium]